MALNLKRCNVPMDIIVKTTGFTEKEIEELE